MNREQGTKTGLKRIRLLVSPATLALCTLLSWSGAAPAATIGFEGVLAPSQDLEGQVLPYAEAGFLLLDVNTGLQNAIWAPHQSGTNTNGTDVFSWGNFRTFAIEEQAGASFAFESFDATNANPGFTGTSVNLVGFLAGGGTLNTSFAMVDETFQTFVLPATWTGLTRIELQAFNGGIAIDNISLTPVPEPSTGSLMALGTGSFAIWRRRCRSSGCFAPGRVRVSLESRATEVMPGISSPPIEVPPVARDIYAIVATGEPTSTEGRGSDHSRSPFSRRH